MARLNQDWQGVPAGTEIKIIRKMVGGLLDGNLMIERVDGKPLPWLGDPMPHSYIAPEFVDEAD